MTDLIFVSPNNHFVSLNVSLGRINNIVIMNNGIPMLTTLEGINWNPAGIVQEFQDLKGKPIDEIKREGIRRFKLHISKLVTEQELVNYLKEDLAKHGYRLFTINKKGFRPIKV
jgi:hypothetical protein